MPISVRCPACSKGLKAPDKAAGKTLACPACGEPLTVPAQDPADILLGDAEPAENGYGLADPVPEPVVPPPPTPRPMRPKPAPVASLHPLTTNDPPA